MLGFWTKFQANESWLQQGKGAGEGSDLFSWRIHLKPQESRDKSESRFLCILNTKIIARQSLYHIHLGLYLIY